MGDLVQIVGDFFQTHLTSIVLILCTTAAATIFTHWSNVSTARRSEALDRLNSQLGDLYGPVRMLRYAGETAFLTFKKKYFPDRPELFWKDIEPSDEDYTAWRVWLKFTLMPINKHIERLLLENGDLIEGREIPKAVLDFLAHVSALDAVIAQWDQGNFKDFKSGIRYPTEFNEHIEKTYHLLVRRRGRRA
jgi:hypothetical protein